MSVQIRSILVFFSQIPIKTKNDSIYGYLSAAKNRLECVIGSFEISSEQKTHEICAGEIKAWITETIV